MESGVDSSARLCRSGYGSLGRIVARETRRLERRRKLRNLGPLFHAWPPWEPRRPEVVLPRSVLHGEPHERDATAMLGREQADDRVANTNDSELERGSEFSPRHLSASA